MQFRGPVPADLYHRYVEFKPFVAGMFTSHSLRGRLLNRGLHHQHARIYNYDRTTKYGLFQEPSIETTKQFLDFTHYDEGGRIFTYVLTLDGQLRFTETGKEFGIDLLSKHTMHSDVSIYIAFSGEFFIRRIKHAKMHKNDSSPDPLTETHPPAPNPDEEEQPNEKQNGKEMENQDQINDSKEKDGCKIKEAITCDTSVPNNTNSNLPSTPSLSQPARDPSHYELIIDNDSGTYRPNAAKLHILHDFLSSNLPGLKISTLDCGADEEKMKKLKTEQRERKEKSGKQVTYMQNSSMSSLSSSDEEELDARARGEDGREGKTKKQYHKFMGSGRDEHHDAGGDGAEGSGHADPNGNAEKHAFMNEQQEEGQAQVPKSVELPEAERMDSSRSSSKAD